MEREEPEKLAIHRFLERYPEMHELYQWKERLHGFYRIRGFDRASQALTHMKNPKNQNQLNGGLTKNRTWNKALGKLRYIHLTMRPLNKPKLLDPLSSTRDLKFYSDQTTKTQ